MGRSCQDTQIHMLTRVSALPEPPYLHPRVPALRCAALHRTIRRACYTEALDPVRPGLGTRGTAMGCELLRYPGSQTTGAAQRERSGGC